MIDATIPNPAEGATANADPAGNVVPIERPKRERRPDGDSKAKDAANAALRRTLAKLKVGKSAAEIRALVARLEAGDDPKPEPIPAPVPTAASVAAPAPSATPTEPGAAVATVPAPASLTPAKWPAASEIEEAKPLAAMGVVALAQLAQTFAGLDLTIKGPLPAVRDGKLVGIVEREGAEKLDAVAEACAPLVAKYADGIKVTPEILAGATLLCLAFPAVAQKVAQRRALKPGAAK